MGTGRCWPRRINGAAGPPNNGRRKRADPYWPIVGLTGQLVTVWDQSYIKPVPGHGTGWRLTAIKADGNQRELFWVALLSLSGTG